MAVPSPAANIARSAIRRELRERRLALAVKTVFPRSPPTQLGALLAASHVTALYLPVTGEPDPLPLASALARSLALPSLSAKGAAMIFRRWSLDDSLETAVWGGLQPCVDAPAIQPDLILVPLLGFDSAFNRLGQGGGHYDRYLAACPAARRIGIAWEGQRMPQINAEPWDVPLDAILTEKDFYVNDLDR